jgi:hypothetical protein
VSDPAPSAEAVLERLRLDPHNRDTVLAAVEAVKHYIYGTEYAGPAGPVPARADAYALVDALLPALAGHHLDPAPLREWRALDAGWTPPVSGMVASGQAPVTVRRAADHLLNSLRERLALRPDAGDTPGRPRPGRLRIDGDAVLLDGEPVLLGMTPETREHALTYLRHLIGADGNWISDGDVNRAEQNRRRGLPGIRWDRVRKKLPDSVRALIRTERSKGSRLDAWHK